jgi:hypothetical protein
MQEVVLRQVPELFPPVDIKDYGHVPVHSHNS